MERMLGTMCRKRILDWLAPSAFEAWMYSSSLILNISPLAMNAMPRPSEEAENQHDERKAESLRHQESDDSREQEDEDEHGQGEEDLGDPQEQRPYDTPTYPATAPMTTPMAMAIAVAATPT